MAPLPHTSSTEVSARRAAALLGMPRSKVTALIYCNVLPARAVGRTYCITLADLERVRTERPDLFPAAA